MKIVSIVGARPQFIKSAPVSMVIADAGYIEYKIHTGQHYDYSMSQIFFDELGIAEPTINLGIGSGTHGRQTGEMLIGIEKELLEQNPDIVIVYGDTNSTLAGSLAACKLNIKLAHVEAGLRSRNRLMPEEHNRVLTDHCSDLLFCPTQTAVNNLSNEGIKKGVHLVGDTMYDAVLLYMKLAEQKSKILQTLGITSKDYLLATIHRAYTTDNPGLLKGIISAFRNSNELIIFPMHPRTGQTFKKFSISIPENVRVIDPVGYLDMIMLEINARLILTDSGGMQKEAYFFSVPCLTLRTETEWTETVESGWNKLVGFDSRTIIDGINSLNWPDQLSVPIYGDGNASKKIIKLL
jgi:UDP-N-acetylglucosamine 2-epimerase